MATSEKDLEAAKRKTPHIPHWRLVWEQGLVTDEILHASYKGSGTKSDPFLVEWLDHDPRNPMLWGLWKKWTVALTMAFATLSVSFCSSAYAGGIPGMIIEFEASQLLVTLGLSMFVLGFALGPLIWAPLSELFGRQILFVTTFGAFAAFNAGYAGARNIWSVIIIRFFAGSFGSSPLTNAGGVIADMFPARERGLAMSVFSVAPFMGPVLGPVIGGFLGAAEGWRWIGGLMAIFSGVCWILGSLIGPETYPPVLLRRRAENLSRITGKVYLSKLDQERGEVSFQEVFSTSLKRPWILLLREPIVFLLSIYMAIIYGTLYLLFGAYPQVYQVARGWSIGIGGLAFIGVAIGMLLALAYTISYDNDRYIAVVEANDGFAPPESRLPPAIIGGIALPIGLFWFAWTNSPSLPWAASVAAGIPFGFGMVLVFLSIMNYLIDSYTIFAASVLAANSVLRSLFGAAFPLFTTQMYTRLGIHWASTIPAFLALACMPFPWLFWKYGASIRVRCKYAAEADEFMRKIRNEAEEDEDASSHTTHSETPSSPSSRRSPTELEKETEMEDLEEQEAIDYSYDKPRGGRSGVEARHSSDEPRLEPIKTQTGRSVRGRSKSLRSLRSEYGDNPFDIDRVNTRESFKGRSREESLKR